jgi:hypothetical protein
MKSQRIAILVPVALAMAGCGILDMKPAPALTLPLVNADFEADFPPNSNCPEGWGCVMHANPKSFRFTLDEKTPASGKRSLCIDPIAREPWARAVQATNAVPVRGMRVRFSVNVKVEGAEHANAEQGGGALVAAQGGRGEYVATKSSLVKGGGWKRVEAEIVVPQTAFVLEYGVAISGPGRVCADDARVEVLPAP